MFRKFSTEENVSSYSKVKSSVQRNIRNKILEQYPMLEPLAEELLPKKEPMFVAKCHDHVQIVLHDNVPLFFNQRDGPFFPTMRLMYKYPKLKMLPIVRTDKGAIPFVLSGANIMCPGLTSSGATMDTEIEAEQPVAVFAEGKELPMALGLMKLSTKDIREVNKGIGIEMIHFLGDDLWRLLMFEA